MSEQSALSALIPRGDVERGQLTEWQIRRILTAVKQDRIEAKQGLSYVPQQEIRAELTRTFGAGNWDAHAHDKQMVYETSQVTGKDGAARERWTICYSVAVTLRIRDYYGRPVAEYTEYHAEENAPQPNRGEAHALALTSSVSYALRRAAISIGDNMGLHLYNKGSVNPIVLGSGTLVDPESPLYAGIQERKAARLAAAAKPQQAAQAPQPVNPEDNTDPAVTAARDAAEAAAVDALAAGFNHPEGRQG